MREIFALSFFLVILAFSAQAKEVYLTSAFNQEDDTVTKLFLEVDQRRDIQKLKVKYFFGERQINEASFDPALFSEGVVLDKRQNQEIIKLYSRNFSSHQGATVDISYLYNGLTGARRFVQVNLARDGDQWGIFREGQKIKELKFISRKWLGRTIGVLRVNFVLK